MTTDAAAFIARCQTHVQELITRIPITDRAREDGVRVSMALQALEEASRYAVGNGGKRIRPVLVYAAAAAVADDTPAAALDALALAVEFIHSYSLVHDDLPAMDDDDLRRGKPSLHRAFDEASAILAGDGLQARAFQLIAEAPELTAGQRIHAVSALARASGPSGMVGGQFIDVAATASEMDLAALRRMHELKTGALIRAAVTLGGIAADGSPSQLEALERYGAAIGLAFQVVDDILDVEGDAATLGKTSGKDFAANKPTYVSLLGLEGARVQAGQLLESALQALDGFGESADLLRALARYIVERDR